MVPGIRFQVSEVRRPERVNAPSNAGGQQGRGTPFRDTVNRDAFRARSTESPAEAPYRNRLPGMPYGSRNNDEPPRENSGQVFDALNRAVQAFSDNPFAPQQSDDATGQNGRYASVDQVPYEALQRASSSQVLGFKPPASVEVEESTGEGTDEPAADPETATASPFEKPETTDPFQRNRASDEPSNVFAAPKEVAEPFGRAIPFDLMGHDSDGANPNPTGAESRSGSPQTFAQEYAAAASPDTAGAQSEIDKLTQKDRDLRNAELRGALAAGASGVAQYIYRTGPDGKQYAVEARVNLDVPAAVAGDNLSTQLKLDEVKRAVGTSRVTPTTPQNQTPEAARVDVARAQVATERYRSADRNQFENVLAVSPLDGTSTQRWSRIGISRPSFAFSLTV